VEHWPAVVFGWPGVVASLLAYGSAFKHRRIWLAAVGAVLGSPFCYYVSLQPNIGGLGIAAILTNTLAVAAFKRGRLYWAAGLLAPFVLLAGTVAVAVVTQ